MAVVTIELKMMRRMMKRRIMIMITVMKNDGGYGKSKFNYGSDMQDDNCIDNDNDDDADVGDGGEEDSCWKCELNTH